MVDGFKEIAGGAMAEMRAQLMGQLREDQHVPTLPTLGLGDEHHLLVKEELLHLDVHKLRHPGARLEQGFDEQASSTLPAVRMGDEPPLLVAGQPCHDPLSLLRPFKSQS